MKKIIIIQVKVSDTDFRKSGTAVARRAIQEFNRGVNAMEADWKGGSFQITVQDLQETVDKSNS